MERRKVGYTEMTGHPFSRHDIAWRLEDCKKHGYDPYALAEAWGISDKGAAGFMRHNCPDEYYKAQTERKHRQEAARIKPEYENQWLFDLFVLTREQYMAKYRYTTGSYNVKLCIAGKEYGYIATPERRARWTKEYWRGM